MSDITNEWRELRSKLGDFICHIDGMNESIESKMKKLQEKEERREKLQEQIDKAYNKGIQDLYDAIRCLFAPCGRVPLMPVSDMHKLFGSVYAEKIIINKSPEEIIDKVNQWKAEKVKEEQELHVGDEVTTNDSTIGIVTSFGEDVVWITYRSTSKARGFDYCWVTKDKCKSTGRHFDSIPFDYNPEKEKVYDLFTELGVDETNLKKEENK